MESNRYPLSYETHVIEESNGDIKLIDITDEFILTKDEQEVLLKYLLSKFQEN